MKLPRSRLAALERSWLSGADSSSPRLSASLPRSPSPRRTPLVDRPRKTTNKIN